MLPRPLAIKLWSPRYTVPGYTTLCTLHSQRLRDYCTILFPLGAINYFNFWFDMKILLILISFEEMESKSVSY